MFDVTLPNTSGAAYRGENPLISTIFWVWIYNNYINMSKYFKKKERKKERKVEKKLKKKKQQPWIQIVQILPNQNHK